MKTSRSKTTAPRSYVVTTSIEGRSMTQVWDPSAPMGVGHPFRWVIEQTDKGVRIRDLGMKPGEPVTQSVEEIPAAKLAESLKSGKPFEVKDIPGADKKVAIRIAPSYQLMAPFEAAKNIDKEPGDLFYFSCIGDWVVGYGKMASSYTGRIQGKPAFTIKKKSGEVSVQFQEKGAMIADIERGNSRPAGDSLELNSDELPHLKIQIGHHTWRFNKTMAPPFSDVVAGGKKTAAQVANEKEEKLFKTSIVGTSAILTGFILLGLIWPKPDPSKEELVPPQYAKIVMAPPREAPPSEPTKASQAAAGAPAAVQKTAAVKALRSEALQNSISGLLKGGMTNLLAQSDLVSGNKASNQAKALFDSKSESLRATSPATKINDSKDTKVSAVGGTGGKEGSGYGKGSDAKITGQGSAHVSLDLKDVNVEEGLSRDEVGEVIHKHMSEVRYCYESAMLRTPDLEGKLMVAFVIGGTGTVKTASVKSSTLSDARLDDCVIRRLMTWKFPQPKGKIEVAVNYPFIFKTLGR
ncbi:AgmX/PglI C-terminal domain-containing protein [bacterium]|nr:AgmX/PglI C-terminal domain-containing protein [bacterium]